MISRTALLLAATVLASALLWSTRATSDADPVDVADYAPSITWSPQRPVQGHLFVIRVTPPAGSRLASATGEAGGEELHFEAAGDGVLESLAPVPIEATGTVEVSVSVTYEDGKTETASPSVPIVAGEYAHEAPQRSAPFRRATKRGGCGAAAGRPGESERGGPANARDGAPVDPQRRASP